ncbi:MAG: hypothetical protein AABW50_02765 [Nanoarchaeota archaeon]
MANERNNRNRRDNRDSRNSGDNRASRNNREKELTPQEKETQREVALKNLSSAGLVSLASAYQVYADKKNYGEMDNAVLEQYKYFPAIAGGIKYIDPETGQETDLMANSILASREDGERYSGSVSEKKVLKTAGSITTQSLTRVKVQDVLELSGSGKTVPERYKNAYVGDLLSSEDKETKEFAKNLIGAYVSLFTSKNVQDAYGARSEDIKKSLETLVAPDEAQSARAA